MQTRKIQSCQSLWRSTGKWVVLQRELGGNTMDEKSVAEGIGVGYREDPRWAKNSTPTVRGGDFEKPPELYCILFYYYYFYTPDIRCMWGCIVFTFPFVRSFVRSFVFPSQDQSFCVKVYKTSYFEDPLMDFIHIWHDGRYRSKVFICTIPTPGVTLGSRPWT